MEKESRRGIENKGKGKKGKIETIIDVTDAVQYGIGFGLIFLGALGLPGAIATGAVTVASQYPVSQYTKELVHDFKNRKSGNLFSSRKNSKPPTNSSSNPKGSSSTRTPVPA